MPECAVTRRPACQVLDTCFDTGQAFFNTWLHWLQDAQAPRMLHYVALCQHACTLQELTQDCAGDARLLALAQQLTGQWLGLLPGFHRFVLAQGQVVLTVCVGDTLELLRQQQFQADTIRLPASMDSSNATGASQGWSTWTAKALARCCRRGTLIHINSTQAQDLAKWQALLLPCGFVFGPAEIRFEPTWRLKNTRNRAAASALPVQRCAVVGAGLAGASVAASLARRGWLVTVLDQAIEPAAGASGLPVGLVLPHVSSDDCALSRLSRAGVRLMLQQASQWLTAGEDWAPTGVLERQVAGTPQLPRCWPTAGLAWSSSYAPQSNGPDDCVPSLWHHQAGWVKPAQLVRAWLRQPGVIFQGNAHVAQLRRVEQAWELRDDAGQMLCRAERVVFANALGAGALLRALHRDYPLQTQTLQQLPAMQGMRGLLSWARHADTPCAGAEFPSLPVNGSGSVIAHIPTADGAAWFMGSSYQSEQQLQRLDQQNHQHNLAHLQNLLPTLAGVLAPVFTSGQLNAWKNTRCVTADRLPLVGPIDGTAQPSLWLCAGMGSRGLSFSVLCAELLAARWGGEPLPVAANLARLLDALRGRRAT